MMIPIGENLHRRLRKEDGDADLHADMMHHELMLNRTHPIF